MHNTWYSKNLWQNKFDSFYLGRVKKHPGQKNRDSYSRDADLSTPYNQETYSRDAGLSIQYNWDTYSRDAGLSTPFNRDAYNRDAGLSTPVQATGMTGTTPSFPGRQRNAFI